EGLRQADGRRRALRGRVPRGAHRGRGEHPRRHARGERREAQGLEEGDRHLLCLTLRALQRPCGADARRAGREGRARAAGRVRRLGGGGQPRREGRPAAVVTRPRPALLAAALLLCAAPAWAQLKDLTLDDIFDPEKKVEFGRPVTGLSWIDDAHYL